MSEMAEGSETDALVRVTRREVTLLRAAASLAGAVEERKRAAHLAAALDELADRIAALLPPLRAVA